MSNPNPSDHETRMTCILCNNPFNGIQGYHEACTKCTPEYNEAKKAANMWNYNHKGMDAEKKAQRQQMQIELQNIRIQRLQRKLERHTRVGDYCPHTTI